MTLVESTNGHGDADDRARVLARAQAELDAGRRPVASHIAEELGTAPRTTSRWIKRMEAAALRPQESRSEPAGTSIRPTRSEPQRRPQGRSSQPASPAPEPDLIDRYLRPAVGWAITVLALVISYSHMRHLAELAGVSWPALVPLLADGLVASAVLCMRRHPRYWAAWLALVLAGAAAMGLNGLAERPELVPLDDVRLWWALLVPAVAAFCLHLVLKR